MPGLRLGGECLARDGMTACDVVEGTHGGAPPTPCGPLGGESELTGEARSVGGGKVVGAEGAVERVPPEPGFCDLFLGEFEGPAAARARRAAARSARARRVSGRSSP
eukprot:scaffold19791_cov135-Isochrysis_galbana.AAC.1